MSLLQTLTGRFVVLAPLEDAHKEGMRRVGQADVETWDRLYPVSWDGDQFELNWSRVMEGLAQGRTLPFAVLHQGRVVGMTRYISPEAGHWVEIGGTFYHPDVRGGVVNPEAKRLLLAHAFASGYQRVQFKVDALNQRSRAAVLKLGATFEGILRQDQRVWTGRVRDTCVFSILADEWPAVRAGLDERIAAFAPA